jgi:hypothetical protein
MTTADATLKRLAEKLDDMERHIRSIWNAALPKKPLDLGPQPGEHRAISTLGGIWARVIGFFKS